MRSASTRVVVPKLGALLLGLLGACASPTAPPPSTPEQPAPIAPVVHRWKAAATVLLDAQEAAEIGFGLGMEWPAEHILVSTAPPDELRSHGRVLLLPEAATSVEAPMIPPSWRGDTSNLFAQWSRDGGTLRVEITVLNYPPCPGGVNRPFEPATESADPAMVAPSEPYVPFMAVLVPIGGQGPPNDVKTRVVVRTPTDPPPCLPMASGRVVPRQLEG